MGLSLKDKRILEKLEFNARKPISKIAKEIKLSKEVTNYHVKKLQNEGIISECKTIFNLYNLGKDYYFIFFKIDDLINNKEKIRAKLNELKRLTKYDFIEGDFNLTMTLYASSYYELVQTIYPFINKLGLKIIHKEIYIITDMFIKKHIFLYNSLAINDSYLYITKNELVPLSTIEKKVTEELTKESSINLTNLKNKLKIDIKTLKKYLSHLEDKKVIMMYRYFVHPEILGYQKVAVFLYLYNFSNERKSLIEILLNQNQITSINLCFGNADIILDIYTKNIKDVYSFLSEITSKFPKLIKKYEMCPFIESVNMI